VFRRLSPNPTLAKSAQNKRPNTRESGGNAGVRSLPRVYRVMEAGSCIEHCPPGGSGVINRELTACDCIGDDLRNLPHEGINVCPDDIPCLCD
jgi:hypothetical protein